MTQNEFKQLECPKGHDWGSLARMRDGHNKIFCGNCGKVYTKDECLKAKKGKIIKAMCNHAKDVEHMWKTGEYKLCSPRCKYYGRKDRYEQET